MYLRNVSNSKQGQLLFVCFDCVLVKQQWRHQMAGSSPRCSDGVMWGLGVLLIVHEHRGKAVGGPSSKWRFILHTGATFIPAPWGAFWKTSMIFAQLSPFVRGQNSSVRLRLSPLSPLQPWPPFLYIILLFIWMSSLWWTRLFYFSHSIDFCSCIHLLWSYFDQFSSETI